MVLLFAANSQKSWSTNEKWHLHPSPCPSVPILRCENLEIFQTCDILSLAAAMPPLGTGTVDKTGLGHQWPIITLWSSPLPTPFHVDRSSFRFLWNPICCHHVTWDVPFGCHLWLSQGSGVEAPNISVKLRDLSNKNAYNFPIMSSLFKPQKHPLTSALYDFPALSRLHLENSQTLIDHMFCLFLPAARPRPPRTLGEEEGLQGQSQVSQTSIAQWVSRVES